jgi:hypothetical protein
VFHSGLGRFSQTSFFQNRKVFFIKKFSILKVGIFGGSPELLGDRRMKRGVKLS